MEIQVRHTKSVLLVDDEREIREPVKQILRMNYGEELLIIEAQDGMDGLYKIQNQKFNCIVTDLNMPRMSGQQLISTLKSSQFNKETPVIVMTGFPDKTLFDKHDFLTMLEKPVSLKILVDNIRSQMDQAPTSNNNSARELTVLVELMQKTFKSMYNLTFVIKRPQTKALGEDFEGAVFYAFRIKRKTEYADFVIGFHHDISTYFGTLAHDPVSQYISQVVEQLVTLHKRIDDNVTLDFAEWKTVKDIGDLLPEWTDRGGVRLRLLSTVGNIDCYGLISSD